ncbi:MerR family transcriptional regulator [Pseudomonas putida]|uniref:Helix-turn-helix-type transcriptional regulator n=1 Tax=Pseudomonas putida TaxID=303 RepID=A0A177SH23_PSEPU|nr:MerR family transcriptional regulator [Pseudomonas putida]OAI88518.1 helix-turn-helix-type transcriptional regulator [Pseudomonas putida]
MPSDQLLPIREIARLTGVNPVTLRAWERRYGLVVPQRTSKGHRLYSSDQVQRIQAIVSWLNRGVAVSQVLPLLDADPPPAGRNTGDDWSVLSAHLTNCIAHLGERQLDQQFNQAMALYPAATLCEQLLLPLLDQLEVRWQVHPCAQVERAFFHSWLRSKLGLRVYHNNRQLNGVPVLLLSTGNQAIDPHLWLCAWLVSDAGCPVEVFDLPLHGRDLAMAAERLGAGALLLSVNTVADCEQLRRDLNPLEVPKLLFGAAVILHKQALGDDPGWHLLDTPLAAQRCLHGLGALAAPISTETLNATDLAAQRPANP